MKVERLPKTETSFDHGHTLEEIPLLPFIHLPTIPAK